jgi:prefoldin subunit 5
MVTKEEFGQFIAEVESFRDLFMEELTKLKTEIENVKETLNDLVRETKVNVNKKIG